MPLRDRASVPSGRKKTAGDVAHRQSFLTPSDGALVLPERRVLSFPGQRRDPLLMPRIAARTASSREMREHVSKGHNRHSLVFGEI